jgi:hypothetical protein
MNDDMDSGGSAIDCLDDDFVDWIGQKMHGSRSIQLGQVLSEKLSNIIISPEN